MQGNRSRDTQPELRIRRAVHALGLRYRVHSRPEAAFNRTADMLFTRARVAVFIDGCYWHGCELHCKMPATNRDFWAAKIDRNRARDRETTTVLRDAGWIVLRYWAHENPEQVAASIRDHVVRAVAEA